MKTRMISAVMAAFMLAAASVGGITASAEEGTAETTETTASEPADESSDDMEKFREVMSELAEAETNDVAPDYDGDPYYDTDGNATLIKSEQIIYNTEEMQFIAVTTKDGHVFYVLINYTAGNGEDNVYFLNKVDDYDLYALLYAGDEDDDEKDKITPEQAAQEAEKANGRVQSGDSNDVDYAEDTAEDGEESSESAAQAKSVPMNKNSMILVFGVVALIGVGVAGFFLMKKKKGGTAPESEATSSVAPKICLSMDSPSPHDVMTYFDMCMVAGDDSLTGDSYLNDIQSRIEYMVNTRLLEFSKRGVCPDVHLAPVYGGVAVYFTYRR